MNNRTHFQLSFLLGAALAAAAAIFKVLFLSEIEESRTSHSA